MCQCGRLQAATGRCLSSRFLPERADEYLGPVPAKAPGVDRRR
jgi:hypothetical protein